MKTAYSSLILTLTILGFFSCKKDPEVNPQTPSIEDSISNKGKIELIFVPMVENEPLFMETNYTSKNLEQFFLSKLSFFISNLGINNYEGKETQVTSGQESGVYLLEFNKPNYDAGHGLQSIKLEFTADTGKYSGLSFDIGVPRELNNSDPTLAPAPLDSATQKGLYWGWDSGYIFMLAEGGGRDVAGNKFHLTIGKRQGIIPFTYGGFGPTRFKVEKDKTTQIVIGFDFQEVLTNQDGSGYLLSESKMVNVHGGPNSLIIRNNTIKAFEFLSFEAL